MRARRFIFFHHVPHPGERAAAEINAFRTHPALQERLSASLMYGANLRLMECLRLRAQDIEFARSEITVRDGKGAKDRIAVFPQSLEKPPRASTQGQSTPPTGLG